ncbi:DUF6766 family protein [Devosia sp. ZW T5_3]|uniref:DUF6766 family protein n=1 Tax=Devosia sp. ZW T5_3 TaxID=3378085 RepID=UPI00385264A0
MRFIRDNGLSLALLAIFLLSTGGMLITGWFDHNAELTRHDAPDIGLFAYFASPAFLSPLFENWESEFLQMSAYVLMTIMLFQRGSSESKDPDKSNPEDADPAKKRKDPKAPWPVRAGGAWSAFYSHSLGLALLALFILSFLLHWLQSTGAANEEALLHGEAPQTAWQYLADPQLWFESFQNWQSEFLSTAVLVLLSVWLRQRGSPESKPVAEPHAKTGH